MKSVMNVIVTTYTIAICWVRERDKDGGREITGAAQAWKVEQIVEFIFEKKKRARESNGLGWSAACHMVELTRTEVTMIPAWLECPSSPLLHSFSLIHSSQNSGTKHFNLDLDAGCPVSCFSSSAERRKEKSEGLFVMTAGATPGLE